MAKEEKEAKKEEVVEAPSPKRKELEALFEAYKKVNPKKAELKKDEFAKKLAAVK